MYALINAETEASYRSIFQFPDSIKLVHPEKSSHIDNISSKLRPFLAGIWLLAWIFGHSSSIKKRLFKSSTSCLEDL